MRIFLIISLLLIALSSEAVNYFVSSAGNDGNSGTSTGATWLTPSRVNSATLNPGDSVFFNRGNIFYGALVVSHSGTSANPIYYGAYGAGAQPVITGFQTVGAWTSLGGNVWQSTAAVTNGPALVNFVTVGGKSVAMGRFPNAGTGYIQFQSHSGSTQITSSGITGTPSYVGADIIIRNDKFIIDRDSVTAQSGGTVTFTTGTGLPYVNGLGYPLLDGWGFFFQNSPLTLDTAGEWYYNRATKKISVYSIGSPATVQVATIDTLVNVSLFDYNTFDHIDFSGANGYAFLKLRAKGIIIQNCNIYNSYYGIRGAAYGGASSLNSRITGCYMHDINDDGVDESLEFTQDTIINNHIERIGVFPGMGGSSDGHYQGMNLTGFGSYIAHNEIDTIGYNGIGFRLSSINIAYNYVHEYCFVKDDGGGIYTQAGATNNYIQWNTVINGIGALNGTINGFPGGNMLSAAYGIYLDDLTSGCSVLHNTTANNSFSGIYFHGANNCKAIYNTSYNNGKDAMLIVDNSLGETTRNGLVIEGNYFVQKDTFGVINFQNLCMAVSSRYNDINNLGTIDYNYYCRPLSDNNTFDIDSNSAGANHYLTNLAGWRAILTNYDAHSHASPISITNTSALLFQYNPTATPVTIPLSFKYIDMTGKTYNGSVTVAAYSSVILIQNGPILVFSNNVKVHKNYHLK